MVEYDALMRLLVHFCVVLFKYDNCLIYMKYSIDGSMIGRLYIQSIDHKRGTHDWVDSIFWRYPFT